MKKKIAKDLNFYQTLWNPGAKLGKPYQRPAAQIDEDTEVQEKISDGIPNRICTEFFTSNLNVY